MEVMMTKWNVYKVFANGKRAKKPYYSFESDTKDDFYNTVFPTMTDKQKKCNWQIIDDRLPQEALIEEPVVTEMDLMIRKRTEFLSQMMQEMYPELETHKHQSCLMFSPETNWKWCWCVSEASTMKYVAQISERFETAFEAEQWMKKQLEQ